MADDGFTTFLADARSLDPTLSVDSACRVWMTLLGIRTIWELRNAELSADQWRIMLLAMRGFFRRLAEANVNQARASR
jgi:hypothetical protein